MRMAATIQTDVLIIGGGPVGLLIAYGLARQGVDSIIVGKLPLQSLIILILVSY